MFTDTVPPTTDRPLPITVTGKLGGGGFASSASFAARHACTSEPNCAASSFAAGQLRLHGLRQREVHVVAAEQQVIADRVADEVELALLLARADQAEVGGAAADIDHEAAHARLQLARLPAASACRATRRTRPAVPPAA